MTGPQVVEVIVRGRLGPELVAALQEFRVGTTAGGDTSLVGSIPDQTRLMGLLGMLDELHIEVVSVNPVPGANGS